MQIDLDTNSHNLWTEELPPRLLRKRQLVRFKNQNGFGQRRPKAELADENPRTRRRSSEQQEREAVALLAWAVDLIFCVEDLLLDANSDEPINFRANSDDRLANRRSQSVRHNRYLNTR
jgi:hypothetical protein